MPCAAFLCVLCLFMTPERLTAACVGPRTNVLEFLATEGPLLEDQQHFTFDELKKSDGAASTQ